MEKIRNFSRYTAAIRHGVLIVALISASLLAAACDTSAASDTTASPHPTATPSLPNLHHLPLGDFRAGGILPMAHGLLLFGTPGSVGHPSDLPPEDIGRPKALYYFDLATNALTQLVAIPANSAETINSVAAAGDWVVYMTGDTNPTDFNAIFFHNLLAINAITHSQLHVAAAEQDGGLGLFTTNGSLVSWTREHPQEQTTVLENYDLVTHHVQAIATFMQPPAPDILDVNPLAIEQGTVLFGESYRGNELPSFHNKAGIYLLKPGSSSPQFLSPSVSLSQQSTMNPRYAIWDDTKAQSLVLYDRQQGTVANAWAASCRHPSITANSSYVACVDYANNQAVVIQAPSGARTVLGSTVSSASGAIVNGHVYWIEREGVTLFGTMLGDWALPTS